MAKPGRSDEVSIDTSKASQPEVPTAVAPAAEPPVQAAEVDEAPPAVAEDAPVISMIAAFERHATAAHHAGNFVAEALLRDVAVAAGELKVKTVAALGRLDGHVGDLIAELHSVL